ncbi:MAG: hypothetical protein IIC67_11320 [Thaumarchaeota archaeon]|nr:hypothetical protein [Nitrososphaerota archaeon]
MLYADKWSAFAITGHNAFDSEDPDTVNDVRDSKQNPVEWHLHLVNVDANFCITSVSDFTQDGISVDKNGVMKVSVPSSEIDGTISGQASGFHVVPGVSDCTGKHPLKLQVQFTWKNFSLFYFLIIFAGFSFYA